MSSEITVSQIVLANCTSVAFFSGSSCSFSTVQSLLQSILRAAPFFFSLLLLSSTAALVVVDILISPSAAQMQQQLRGSEREGEFHAATAKSKLKAN